MRYRVLGPLEVREPGTAVELSPKLRDLLALLLCRPDRPVSSGRLIDGLWGDAPPRSALTTLRGYVHHLRRAVGTDRLASHSAGYVLRVLPGELDSDVFTALVEQGRKEAVAGEPERAAASFGEALSLWRGAPYEDQDHLVPTLAESVRLDELRLGAIEERVEAELRLGRHSLLVGELRSIAAASPLRERPRVQLALALYRAGRISEALEVCREGRRIMAEELGLDPGPGLRRLEGAILCHDPSLRPPRPAAAV
ncbi:AfsR/SARP family transcriptional regulator [Spirillospora sp. CA-294931]|uniref:AfsR/SARP family transcriptional regulator n=1 Tax=Spirillospora sp. CA-294931 TaxID=3240042 RepID=UPI003D8BF2B3